MLESGLATPGAGIYLPWNGVSDPLCIEEVHMMYAILLEVKPNWDREDNGRGR